MHMEQQAEKTHEPADMQAGCQAFLFIRAVLSVPAHTM
ncbi:hypothetical protein DDI_3659 [Dickeya dianthicola RNS04.9]|nr:hypothetical protein DDI_3659 [Dickeya dianthicola RNS04.9]